MSERPRILDYAPPSRKLVRTAWWFFLSGMALFAAVGALILAVS